MCLYVKNPINNNLFTSLFRRQHYKKCNPLVAKEDIICYKKYRILKDGETLTILSSPFLNMHVYVNNFPVHLDEIPYSDFISIGYNKRNSVSNINFGYHSLLEKEDAINVMRGPYSTKYVVVKCMIPTGALYYKGEFGFSESFSSNKLILLEYAKR